MKQRFFVTLSVLLGSLAVAWADEPASTTLDIRGMTCGGCVAAVEVQLGRTAGVVSYDVSFEDAEATVRYDPSVTTPEAVAASVSETGFHASVQGAPASTDSRTSPDVPRGVTSREAVTLFQVPLMCPAVKGLGCGGKARPLMADLEARPEIAQAWLDHAGTRLAVVWTAPVARSRGVRLVQKTFGEKGLSVTPLEGSALTHGLQDFAARQGWYEGQDVDRLTAQEGGALAHRMTRRVARRGKLSPASAAALEADLRSLCTDALLHHRRATDGSDLVNSASRYLDADQLAVLKRSLQEGFGPQPGDPES